MNKRPLFILSVFFVIGIIIAKFLPDSVRFHHFFILSSIFILSSFIFSKREKLSNIFLFLSVISFAVLLYLNSNIFPSNHISKTLGEERIKTKIVGIIKSPILNRKPYYGKITSTYLFELEAMELEKSWLERKGLTQIRIQTEEAYKYGDRVFVEGVIKKPYLPIKKDAFNYREYLKNQKIFAIVTAKEENIILLSSDYKVNSILRNIYLIRGKIKKEIIDKLLNMEGLMTKKKEIGLRDYQEKAITEWINNKFRGIFEMATGTGKTFTALGCLCKLREIKERLVTVICCPYGHLVSQWSKEITNFGFEDLIIIADSSNRNWNEEVANNINYVNNDYKKRFIIITTYRTFSSNKFIELINKVDTDLFIIADEMHWSGAESYKKGLIEKYNLRLGLSATPIRYMDDEGSTSISNYFGGSIYQFDLKRAINEINPDTGKSYLTPYNYYPYFIELEGNELEEYDLLSKKMARIYRSIRDKSKKEEMLQRLAEKRQKIITNASNKITAFNEIIDILTELKYALVYCSEKQIDKIQEILGNQDIINHRFTGEEGTTPSKSYGGLSERDFLLKKFAETTYQVLVAMKCLDEGVDVPPARKAVILASSGNPKEYIQRRGRVLRRFPGKEIADIYDIIVVPSLSGVVSDDFIKMEKNILTKEIKRYEEFAKIANNGLEALNKIFPIKRRYNLA